MDEKKKKKMNMHSDGDIASMPVNVLL